MGVGHTRVYFCAKQLLQMIKYKTRFIPRIAEDVPYMFLDNHPG
jgi:hypothetical protein